MTNIDRLKCVSLLCLLVAACGEATPAPSTPASMTPPPPPPAAAASPGALPPPASTSATTTAASPPPAAPKPPPDAARIATATGGKPETNDNTVKVSFPRDDLPVTIDGWKMPPFMGLTSWAAFVAGEKAGVESMVMGDFVLFEDEVNPAMSAALDNGIEVTALHNHFFFDKPRGARPRSSRAASRRRSTSRRGTDAARRRDRSQLRHAVATARVLGITQL